MTYILKEIFWNWVENGLYGETGPVNGATQAKR